MEIKLGCDPEIFITKNNEIVWPTSDILPGNKSNPFPVKEGAVQIDGAAVEFNITPSSDEQEFSDRIETVMVELKALLGNEFEFSRKTSHKFPVEIYENLPEELKQIGCDPYRNAYSSMIVEPFQEKQLKNFRMVGGHIHIGWTENENIDDNIHILSCEQLVKELDCYITLPGLLFNLDKDRMKFYGSAGNFRVKPYGVEYRTPCNWWIWKEEYRKFIFRQVNKAIKNLLNNTPIENEHPGGANLYINDISSNYYVLEYITRYIPEFIKRYNILKDSGIELPRVSSFNGTRNKKYG